MSDPVILWSDCWDADGNPVPTKIIPCAGKCGKRAQVRPDITGWTCDDCRRPLDDCPQCNGSGMTLSIGGGQNIPIESAPKGVGGLYVSCDCWRQRYSNVKVGDTVQVQVDVLATYTYPDCPVVRTDWVDVVVKAVHGWGTVTVLMPSGEIRAYHQEQYRTRETTTEWDTGIAP